MAEALGLPKPLFCGVNIDAIRARAEQIYSNVYTAINNKLEADKAAATKSASVTAAAESAVLERRDPEDLLNSLLDSKIDNAFG